MDYKKIAGEIFLEGVKSVLPQNIIHNAIRIEDATLIAGNKKYNLDSFDNIYVIGAGKASGQMAQELENLLGTYISEGIVITKYGHAGKTSIVEIIEAGHPVPDSNGVEGAKRILEIAAKANENDLVIVLLSGGGSALLTDVPDGLTLNEIRVLSEILLKSGADITEVNSIRKLLSEVKGGKLAQSIYPAHALCLILSDVVGDKLDVIASGPTVPDSSNSEQAFQIIEKYRIQNEIPESILNYILKGIKKDKPESPEKKEKYFENVNNLIIGSNKIALNACKDKACKVGLHTIVSEISFTGDTKEVADKIINGAIRIQNDSKIPKPACLLFGGESSLKVTGKGKGGRNMHMALVALVLLRGKNGITFLAAGTDGSDGPTDAAGAVIDHESYGFAISNNIAIDKYLSEFDSYHFFEKTDSLIITGPTLTNVMDLVVVIVEEE